jgi:DNA polymerase-3 subunit gamma/tau
MIARQGAGSLRDAESLLDQLVMAPDDVITVERTQMVLGTASDTAVINLTDAWLSSDGATGLSTIHEALASGTDARQFSRQIVVYLRELLLLQAAGQEMVFDGTPEQKQVMLGQAQRAPRAALIDAIRTFSEAAMSAAGSWQPQLPLELAFIEMLPETPMPAQPVAQPAAKPQPKPAAAVKITTPPPKVEPVVQKETVVETAVPEPAQPETQSEMEEVVAETAVSKPAPTAKAKLSLSAIKTNWRVLVEQAGSRNRNLPALLNMSKPLATEGNTLVLGFDYPIFKEKFDNTQGGADLIGEIVSELTHVKSHIRCVITSEYTVNIGREDLEDLAGELGGIVKEED